MKINNTQVQYLYNWLNAPLHGEQARARNKFTAIIEKQYLASLDGRTDILKKFADKDKKTKEPVVENGLYKMSKAEDKDKAQKEVTKFLAKETTYALTKNEKALVKTVIKILNDAKIPLDISNGKVYDSVMSELEAVKLLNWISDKKHLAIGVFCLAHKVLTLSIYMVYSVQ